MAEIQNDYLSDEIPGAPPQSTHSQNAVRKKTHMSELLLVERSVPGISRSLFEAVDIDSR